MAHASPLSMPGIHGAKETIEMMVDAGSKLCVPRAVMARKEECT
jgi:hypothetical protein